VTLTARTVTADARRNKRVRSTTSITALITSGRSFESDTNRIPMMPSANRLRVTDAKGKADPPTYVYDALKSRYPPVIGSR